MSREGCRVALPRRRPHPSTYTNVWFKSWYAASPKATGPVALPVLFPCKQLYRISRDSCRKKRTALLQSFQRDFERRNVIPHGLAILYTVFLNTGVYRWITSLSWSIDRKPTLIIAPAKSPNSGTFGSIPRHVAGSARSRGRRRFRTIPLRTRWCPVPRREDVHDSDSCHFTQWDFGVKTVTLSVENSPVEPFMVAAFLLPISSSSIPLIQPTIGCRKGPAYSGET